jgi:hypothetical protein
MRIIIWILLFFAPQMALPQVIIGQLVDMNTMQPVSYAHVYVDALNIGTISNELGAFEIKITDQRRAYEVSISHISYDPATIAVENDTVMQILLQGNAIHLQDVVVSNKGYNLASEAMGLLENAEPIYGRVFYRQTTLQDTVPTEFIESFFHVAQSQQGIQKVAIEQARFARKRIKDVAYFFFSNFSYLTTGFRVYANQTRDLAFPFSLQYFDKYSFRVTKEYSKAGDNYVVVGFSPDQMLENLDSVISLSGSFTYNASRKELIEYRSSIHHSLGADKIEFEGDAAVSVSDPVYNWIVGFACRNGVCSISHILAEYTFRLSIDGPVQPVKVNSKAVFFEMNDKPHRKLRSPSPGTEGFDIFAKARYRPKYWRDNPIITRTPQEEAMISSFEKDNAFGTYFK